MITQNDLVRANQLVADFRQIESALRELRAGGSVQSLTVMGKPPKISTSDATRFAYPERGTPPSPEAFNLPLAGAFITVNNLEFPQRLLEGLAEHLQHRLQQISNELREMGIQHGSET